MSSILKAGGKLPRCRRIVRTNPLHRADNVDFAKHGAAAGFASRDIMTKTTSGMLACGVAAVIMSAGVATTYAQDTKAPAAPPAAAAGSNGSAWNAEVAKTGGTSGIQLDEKQTEVVKRVSKYFDTLENLKGAFVQTGPDKKRMKGKFYVKKPGRFRFDYSLPSKQVIVSDGQYLAVQDQDINTEDRVSLDQTAFRLLLRKDVDLIRDAKIVEVQTSDDLIIVALQDKSPDAPGKIKLIFVNKPAFELKEWVTSDAQGLDTSVEIFELNKTDQLEAGLFKIQPMGMPKATP
jgi:outer membrane lipoprotein-sorting protein